MNKKDVLAVAKVILKQHEQGNINSEALEEILAELVKLYKKYRRKGEHAASVSDFFAGYGAMDVLMPDASKKGVQ